MLALIAVPSIATDWKGMTGIGIRGPVFIPLFRGSDFEKFGKRYEPFMMGLDGALEVKYGLSKRLVVTASAAYLKTYDDSSATDNQGMKFNKDDNAFAKLTALSVGVALQYYLMPDKKTQPYILMGLGSDFWRIKSRPFDADKIDGRIQDFTFKYGAGINFWLGEKFTLDLQARMTHQIPKVSTTIQSGFYGAEDWETGSKRPFNAYMEPSIGLTYYFGRHKEGEKAAPVPEKDSDGDGIVDSKDKCPNTPQGAIVDKNGCPLDSDKDGVFDGLDKCPDTPAGVQVDAFGCPPGEADSDKDGVPDSKDQCPNTPAGMTVNELGCPTDDDMDGVPNNVDECPGTPQGTEVDEKGCPKVARISEKIILHINYASDSYEPDAAAKATLDSVAQKMILFPDIRIEVRGFTDDQNTVDHNNILGQRRAEGVKDYLIGKGIEAGRIVAKGFGEDPQYFIGDNATPEGRRKNRRVEIESIGQ
jgi:outer membrane protein OmpA-like peptidoglycan-associated protein/opacity protein-like surface antigen